MNVRRLQEGDSYRIYDFMVFDLKLKGNELALYACIYNFAQPDGFYYDGLQFLADWINKGTEQKVRRYLKKLIDKNLIIEKDGKYMALKKH